MTREAMNRPVRIARPLLVTSATSTTPLAVETSTRLPDLVASISKRWKLPPVSTVTSTRSPFMGPILGPPGPEHGAVRPFSGEAVWSILFAGTISETTEGGTVKKFLILLGIIGLVVAIAMYMRSRQGELEY
jgi:hypothetical protein